MTAGAGWIALALVVFASWQPFRLLIGAYIFGGITLLQLNLQALGLEINVALFVYVALFGNNRRIGIYVGSEESKFIRGS